MQTSMNKTSFCELDSFHWTLILERKHLAPLSGGKANPVPPVGERGRLDESTHDIYNERRCLTTALGFEKQNKPLKDEKYIDTLDL